jgi:N-acetylmuramoyl-L-alanine amidase
MLDSAEWTRRKILAIAATFLCVPNATGFSKTTQSNFRISNRWSPLNRKRPRRPYTRYIILHTTEGEEKGALSKLIRYGETHYFVSKSGRVYRIIDKSKIARHTGRSMWEGRRTIDNYSIGIEVSGYHNRDITSAQYTALRELLRQLKSLYGISDKNILTHSMVAYGRPNRFQSSNHRGRKRCGMIFARPEVRARLGLKSGPTHDPDVKAGRLKIGDKALFRYLFSGDQKTAVVASAKSASSPPTTIEATSECPIIDDNRTAWQIAREQYNNPQTTYIFPNGKKLAGNQIKDWTRLPSGTRVLLGEMEDDQPFEGFLEIGKDGDTAKEIAGMAYTSALTIYFFPDGLIRTGAELNRRKSNRRLLDNPPKGTRVLVGYLYGGHVKSGRSPISIAGKKWNYPSTYYRYPDGTILNGDDVNARTIPPGTLIFYQR